MNAVAALKTALHFLKHNLGQMLTRQLKRALRFIQNKQETNLRASIEDVLGQDGQDGGIDFSHQERHMLRNLLGFRDLRVDDVMVPRADIEALDVTLGAAALLARFTKTGHARMPVFRDTLDQPLGMLHVKHVLAAYYKTEGRDPPPIETLMRDLLYVPPSMPCLELLLKMQATHTHMALVIDEYGGTDGLVSIGDLIKEIIGEIDDEKDAPILLAQQGAYHWRAAARVPLDDLQARLHLPFFELGGDADIDTLGGLIFTLIGRVPQRGEMIVYEFADGRSVEFIIRDGDPRRVKTIDIRLPATPDDLTQAIEPKDAGTNSGTNSGANSGTSSGTNLASEKDDL